MKQGKVSIRVGFLASHNGTAFRKMLEDREEAPVYIIPSVLITNNRSASCLKIVEKYDVPSFVVNEKSVGEGKVDQAIRDCLVEHNVDLVVLAGYMKKIGPETLRTFSNKILNSHPALLPKFGGQGMYGRYVHEAVIAAKEKESGVTVHFVNAKYDEGPIVTQIKIPLTETETVESLEERIKAIEFKAYLQAIARLMNFH